MAFSWLVGCYIPNFGDLVPTPTSETADFWNLTIAVDDEEYDFYATGVVRMFGTVDPPDLRLMHWTPTLPIYGSYVGFFAFAVGSDAPMETGLEFPVGPGWSIDEDEWFDPMRFVVGSTSDPDDAAGYRTARDSDGELLFRIDALDLEEGVISFSWFGDMVEVDAEDREVGRVRVTGSATEIEAHPHDLL